MADTRFAVRLGLDQAQEAQARRLGENLEQARNAQRIGLPDLVLEQRSAVGGDDDERFHDGKDIDSGRYRWQRYASTAIDLQEQAMSETLDPITRHQIEHAAEELHEEFAGIFSTETIARYIEESTDLLSGAQFSTYVPLLVHRFARERLRALAQAQGRVEKEQPEVTFVCVHNAGRSQMAAGLVKLRSGGRIHVRSAGSDPADRINPAVVEAMREIGVDMTQDFPKPLTDEVVQAADAVITMSCGDACPVYPGKRYEDWELDDPAGQDLDAVRRIRDELDQRVRRLIGELLTSD
jgi:protein-tyrosine-phosphatase